MAFIKLSYRSFHRLACLLLLLALVCGFQILPSTRARNVAVVSGAVTAITNVSASLAGAKIDFKSVGQTIFAKTGNNGSK